MILGNSQSIVIHNAETKLRIEIAFPGSRWQRITSKLFWVKREIILGLRRGSSERPNRDNT